MGLSTHRHCVAIIESVNEYEEEDWEFTTREERYWMQEARDLAELLKEKNGYVDVA